MPCTFTQLCCFKHFLVAFLASLACIFEPEMLLADVFLFPTETYEVLNSEWM